MLKIKKLSLGKKNFLIGAVIVVETVILLFLVLKLIMINVAVLTSSVGSLPANEFVFAPIATSEEFGEEKILTLPAAQTSNIDLSFHTSPNGASFAYIIKTEKGQAVVLNGQAGKFYSEITFLTFSPDSQRFAYGVKNKAGEMVVLDGQEGKYYDWIFTPHFFTPDSRYFVYKTRTDQGDILVFNTQESRAFDQIYEPLLSSDQVYNPLISPDKIRLVYYGRSGSQLWRGVLESSAVRAD